MSSSVPLPLSSPAVPYQTHEVFNQSPPLHNYNLYTTNKALQKHIALRGLTSLAEKKLRKTGEALGHEDSFARGRQANENPPRLKNYSEKGERLDQVEFHPAYHELMQKTLGQSFHGGFWQKPFQEGVSLARACVLYMTAQVECGHICPITMTHAGLAPLYAHAGTGSTGSTGRLWLWGYGYGYGYGGYRESWGGGGHRSLDSQSGFR